MHYGIPTNPSATERIPGGPSSGASVAVAANLADFSLGELHGHTVANIHIFFHK